MMSTTGKIHVKCFCLASVDSNVFETTYSMQFIYELYQRKCVFKRDATFLEMRSFSYSFFKILYRFFRIFSIKTNSRTTMKKNNKNKGIKFLSTSSKILNMIQRINK